MDPRRYPAHCFKSPFHCLQSPFIRPAGLVPFDVFIISKGYISRNLKKRIYIPLSGKNKDIYPVYNVIRNQSQLFAVFRRFSYFVKCFFAHYITRGSERARPGPGAGPRADRCRLPDPEGREPVPGSARRPDPIEEKIING